MQPGFRGVCYIAEDGIELLILYVTSAGIIDTSHHVCLFPPQQNAWEVISVYLPVSIMDCRRMTKLNLVTLVALVGLLYSVVQVSGY